MAEMKIVNVNENFKCRLKSEAALRSISLSEYVLELIQIAQIRKMRDKQARKK
jgi:hypothetical protein